MFLVQLFPKVGELVLCLASCDVPDPLVYIPEQSNVQHERPVSVSCPLVSPVLSSASIHLGRSPASPALILE